MKCSVVMKNVYRAKWCERHNMKPLCRFFMLVNAVVWNCHIDYRADIPKSVSISHHGSGVVINQAVKIGEKSLIAHGVTIGNRMPFHEGSPVIGSNCYIGSGAYLGGGVLCWETMLTLVPIPLL